MKRSLFLFALMLVGCAAKEVPLPQVEQVPKPDDLSTYHAPTLYAPPPPAPVVVAPPKPKPPAPNEARHVWQDGEATPVQVQIGFPTVARFQPGEKITFVADGDTGLMTETEEQRQQPADKQHQCHYGARWQYCRAVSETRYAPVESMSFTATHASQRQGLVVFTDQRSYYLELQAVRQTKTRLVSWSVPQVPAPPAPPKEPGLFPDLAAARQFHIGYRLTIPHATPDFTPVKIFSDLPTVAAAKMYIEFDPVMMHQRIPLIRGMTELGKPYLLNARWWGTWVVVDGLHPRLELRQGAKPEDALVVVISREQLRPIRCPGDVECPVWPQ